MSIYSDDNKLVVRAANLLILKKVADVLGKSSKLYEVLEINRRTVDRMIAIDEQAGKNWKYVQVAEKMKMDPAVFSGDYLIKVEGELYKAVKIEFVKNSTDDKNLQQYSDLVSELSIWEITLENMRRRYKDCQDDEYSEEEKMFSQSKLNILQDVAKQTKNKSFIDDQLLLFENYMRKL